MLAAPTASISTVHLAATTAWSRGPKSISTSSTCSAPPRHLRRHQGRPRRPHAAARLREQIETADGRHHARRRAGSSRILSSVTGLASTNCAPNRPPARRFQRALAHLSTAPGSRVRHRTRHRTTGTAMAPGPRRTEELHVLPSGNESACAQSTCTRFRRERRAIPAVALNLPRRKNKSRPRYCSPTNGSTRHPASTHRSKFGPPASARSERTRARLFIGTTNYRPRDRT